VTTQAEILKLVRDLIHEVHTSVMFITHDLATVGHITDRVAVMYAGEIIEEAPTDELLSNPKHPYTKGLIASFPTGYKRSPSIQSIPGTVPDLRNLPSGCKFHSRCPYAFEPCAEKIPAWTPVATAGHSVACHLYGGEKRV
jgi:oligopeptide/dipeptide ABC transporter ATP-binding protein